MRCPKCEEFVYSSERHRCPPRWLCWYPDSGTREDAEPVYARGASEAAEEFVERTDPECDYSCISGNLQPVHVVLDEPGASVQVFLVEGEAVPEYHARVEATAQGIDGLFRVGRCSHPRRKRADGSTYFDESVWAVELEDLDGEEQPSFSLPTLDLPKPEFGDYVRIEGELGSPGSRMTWGPRGRYSVTL